MSNCHLSEELLAEKQTAKLEVQVWACDCNTRYRRDVEAIGRFYKTDVIDGICVRCGHYAIKQVLSKILD